MKNTLVLILLCLPVLPALSQERAREWGIPFDGVTGTNNAITDVPGVEVGHSTIIRGEGDLVIGEGPVRTGVTTIFPRGKKFSPVYANWYSLNGNGEMVGTTWITESGFLETPILITNTNSVGVVRDAVLEWYVETNWYGDDEFWYTYPLVAETYDGFLNDIYGFHVTPAHVVEALESAAPGPVAEGNVGGGTGMVCLGFKGGIGTSSRKIVIGDSTYTLGVLVQSNFGGMGNFKIAGVPVGTAMAGYQGIEFHGSPNKENTGRGSIIVVVATDAPLLPHQLKRLVHRVPLGIGAVGGYGGNESGDIFIAFSTANEAAFNRDENAVITVLPNDRINPLLQATAQAVEESIINAMVAAETMSGIHGNTVHELPEVRVKEILSENGRLLAPELLTTEYLESFEGRYTHDSAGEFRIWVEDRHLKLKIPESLGNGTAQLNQIGKDKFKTDNGTVIEFTRTANGQVNQLIIVSSRGMEAQKSD